MVYHPLPDRAQKGVDIGPSLGIPGQSELSGRVQSDNDHSRQDSDDADDDQDFKKGETGLFFDIFHSLNI
jgi:hypothetical protein